MGMFDTISISDPLPFTEEMISLGLDINNHNWQTKDLHNAMETYFIQGGELFVEKFNKEVWVEGDKNAEHFLDRMGHLERQEPYLKKIPFHGEIIFYDYAHDVDGKWDCWVEFKAIFTNGSLQKIELVKFNKEDNSERLEREKKWKEQLEHSERVWYNKYFRHTKAYHWFAHRVWYSFFMNLGNLCHKISHIL